MFSGCAFSACHVIEMFHDGESQTHKVGNKGCSSCTTSSIPRAFSNRHRSGLPPPEIITNTLIHGRSRETGTPQISVFNPLSAQTHLLWWQTARMPALSSKPSGAQRKICRFQPTKVTHIDTGSMYTPIKPCFLFPRRISNPCPIPTTYERQ